MFVLYTIMYISLLGFLGILVHFFALFCTFFGNIMLQIVTECYRRSVA